MIHLLKEVGKGKRGSRDLTPEEAGKAAELIISRQASPAQIGAFLMAERMKMESEDELWAFIEVLRRSARHHPMKGSLYCSNPFDGRCRTFMAGFAAAFVTAACGLPVSIHTGASLPPKRGVTEFELLQALNIQLDKISGGQLVYAAEESGVLILPIEKWCPPLGALRSIREELGMRTLINTAEKLLNAAESPYLSIGVFHNTVFDRMSRLIARSNYKRGIIIQGMEGSGDISVEKPTRTCIVQNGQTDLYIINPEVLDLDASVPATEWTPHLQLQLNLEVLEGTAALPFYNMVLLNSALRLFIAEQAESLEEAIYRAKLTLDNGSALKKYNQWLSLIRTPAAEICRQPKTDIQNPVEPI